MGTQQVGRPPNSEINVALKRAAEQSIRAVGHGRVTVDSLVRQVGTTRPAFYRRYASLDYLILDVLSDRFVPGCVPDTGALYTDLVAIQQERAAVLADPLVRNALPTLLEAVRVDHGLRDAYAARFLHPRRVHLETIIAKAVSRGELSAGQVDIEFIYNQLLGPLLAQVLDPLAGAPDQQLAQDTATATAYFLTRRYGTEQSPSAS